MTNEERKETTYIASAEIRMEHTERRDKLVNAAKAVGFIVECTEAIDISFSGYSGPEHWAITVYASGKLDQWDRREARTKLAAAWKGL